MARDAVCCVCVCVCTGEFKRGNNRLHLSVPYEISFEKQSCFFRRTFLFFFLRSLHQFWQILRFDEILYFSDNLVFLGLRSKLVDRFEDQEGNVPTLADCMFTL